MKNPIPKNEHSEFVPYSYPIEEKVFLKKSIVSSKKDFLQTVFQRKSISKLNKPAEEKIYQLLEYCCKIRELSIDESGFLVTKRTVPSAGARHPIDLLISIPGISQSRILSYYNPIDHSINKLSIPEYKLQNFYSEINKSIDIKNSAVIWFSIQPAKTGSKYENPESLYWRDAGALLYCLQLIGTYLGLGSCPVGTLAVNEFKDIFGNQLISGGGIVIGN